MEGYEMMNFMIALLYLLWLLLFAINQVVAKE
jgi:hypothetical protein